MSAADDDLALRAWRAVARSHARVWRGLDADLTEKAGLPFRSYEVLLRLSRAPGSSMRMAELAVSVLLTPSGVTRLVDSLVERGLILRKADPSDARGQLAVLTSEGRALLRKCNPVYQRAVRRHFADHFSPEQLVAIAEAFESLLARPERAAK